MCGIAGFCNHPSHWKENIEKMKEAIAKSSQYAETYKNWNGTSNPTYDDVINYKEYTEFKTSTFEIAQKTDYHPNGQIQKIYLKWKNLEIL